MTMWWEAFFTGVMAALLPSMIFVLIMLWTAPRHPDDEEDLMIVYAHENAEAVLEKLTPKATDAEIANALAIYLLCGKIPPIVMSINHNASAAPCPLRIDTPGKKSSSVAFRKPAEAKAWAIDALVRGYELSCGTRRGQETRSIAGERRKITHRIQMADYYAARKANPHLDDEIPF